MKVKEINKEDREFILFAYSLINSAKYPSFEKVTETYNRVFGTTLNNTSCGTCVRQRILDLKKELDKVLNYEKENASSNQNKSISNENNELNRKEVNQSQEVKESDTVEGEELSKPKKQPLKQQRKSSKEK